MGGNLGLSKGRLRVFENGVLKIVFRPKKIEE
jgi:hypothetical protein